MLSRSPKRNTPEELPAVKPLQLASSVCIPSYVLHSIFKIKIPQSTRTLAVSIWALKEHNRLYDKEREPTLDYFVERSGCTPKSIQKAQSVLQSLNLWN